MYTDNLLNFGEALPANLIKNGISLQGIGIDEYIWRWNDAIEVVNRLTEKEIFILGGDVYLFINGNYKYSNNGWYIQLPKHKILNEDLLAAQSQSIKYIHEIMSKIKEECFFSITAKFLQ